MLRFIKNKAKRRSGSNVDLIKVVMPMGETLPTGDSQGKKGNMAGENNNHPVKMNGIANGIHPGLKYDMDDSKTILYEDPDKIIKKMDGILGGNNNPELGIDLDDLLKEVEKDLKDLTAVNADNSTYEDVIYAKPQRPPSKPPRKNLTIFPDDKSEDSGNELEKERMYRSEESMEFDSDEETSETKKQPRDPRRENLDDPQPKEHFSRDSFIEGNHDVMVVKDGVPYVFPTSSGSETSTDDNDKPESERSYGRSFRIDPKNPTGLKEVTQTSMMTTFTADTPITVTSPLLFQDTNLLVANGHLPNMPSSVPIRNGNLKNGNGNGNGNRRVQFRDDSSVISNGNTVTKVPIDAFNKDEDELVVIEEGVEDGRKVDEDALSLGSEASDMSESDLRPRTLRTRRTVAIVFAWICMGFFSETIGPNYSYLMSRTSCTYEELSRAVAGRGLGFIVGAVLGGLLCEALPYWLDLWVAISLVLAAVCTAALPWCDNLIYIGITLSCIGLTKGLLTVAVLSIVIQIWNTKYFDLIVMMLYAAYAFGAAPTAEMAYLFSTGVFESLGTHSNGHHANHTSTNGHHQALVTNGHDNVTLSTTEEDESIFAFIPKPMYPFDIAALMSFLGGAVFLVLFGSSVIATPKMPKAIKKTIWDARIQNMKPSKWFKPKVKLGPRTVFFLIAFFLLPLAMEICFGRFLMIYAEMTSLSFGKDMSTYVQMMFWGGILLGRLFTPLFARCAAPNGLAITCLTTGIISSLIIIAYGEKFRLFFWIFSTVTGFFIGPILPLGLTWCNIYQSLSPMGLVVPMVMVGSGEALFSWLMGYILQIYGPRALLLYSLATSGLAFLLYLPLIPLLAKKRKWRITKRKKVAD